MQLTVEQLKWLIPAISAAPANTLDDTERKADVLKAACQELRQAVQAGELVNDNRG